MWSLFFGSVNRLINYSTNCFSSKWIRVAVHKNKINWSQRSTQEWWSYLHEIKGLFEVIVLEDTIEIIVWASAHCAMLCEASFQSRTVFKLHTWTILPPLTEKWHVLYKQHLLFNWHTHAHLRFSSVMQCFCAGMIKNGCEHRNHTIIFSFNLKELNNVLKQIINCLPIIISSFYSSSFTIKQPRAIQFVSCMCCKTSPLKCLSWKEWLANDQNTCD